ncbi:DUF2510 domain-containing protein [Nocardia vinacea]|uniref:DUF2510 domain-containing protein n=1 Tax=Nocardia vinacea TaxID=96468 RepID=UPI002E12AC43|nr:DUF2510 domain-containing protein [Nocardia vinacea]
MGAISLLHILILLVIVAVPVVIVLIVKSGSRGGSQASAMAPGWYPDHANPALVRWFDGYQWTNYTQPRQ